jgi:hypothetical protein
MTMELGENRGLYPGYVTLVPGAGHASAHLCSFAHLPIDTTARAPSEEVDPNPRPTRRTENDPGTQASAFRPTREPRTIRTSAVNAPRAIQAQSAERSIPQAVA